MKVQRGKLTKAIVLEGDQDEIGSPPKSYMLPWAALGRVGKPGEGLWPGMQKLVLELGKISNAGHGSGQPYLFNTFFLSEAISIQYFSNCFLG